MFVSEAFEPSFGGFSNTFSFRCFWQGNGWIYIKAGHFPEELLAMRSSTATGPSWMVRQFCLRREGRIFVKKVNVIIILKKPKVWNMFIKQYVNVLVCFQWVILAIPLHSWISLTEFQPCTFWVGCRPMFCPKIADFDGSKLWKPPLSISSHCLCWFVSYQFGPSVYVWQTC